MRQSRLFTDRTPYNTIDFKRSKQKDGIALPYIDNNIINNKIKTTNNKTKNSNNLNNTIDHKEYYTKNLNNKPYTYPHSKACCNAKTYEMDFKINYEIIYL